MKLSREKTFAKFEVLWLFAKVFFAKFGGVVSFGGTSEQFVKVFSVKILFSTNSRKFSPAKVFRYMHTFSHAYIAARRGSTFEILLYTYCMDKASHVTAFRA